MLRYSRTTTHYIAAVLTILHGISTDDKRTGTAFNQDPRINLGPRLLGVPMAGMMDTVLNLGLNDKTVEALAKMSGDRRFAFDSYRRFIQMYSDVVLGIEHDNFEKHLERAKTKRGVKQESIGILMHFVLFLSTPVPYLCSFDDVFGDCFSRFT